MAAVAIRIPKPKMTMSAVQGRILVFAEDGERIGQWGGTECFLSHQTGLGPCLVVRSSKHKRHQGTFFQLTRLQRVLSTHVAEGKLTIVVPHERRTCSVYVETTEDLDELRMMSGVLQDRGRWVDMERNVASKTQKGTRHGRGILAETSVGGANRSGGLGERSMDLRDPSRAQLTGRGPMGSDDEEEEDDDDYVYPDGRTHRASHVPPSTGEGDRMSDTHPPENSVHRDEGAAQAKHANGRASLTSAGTTALPSSSTSPPASALGTAVGAPTNREGGSAAHFTAEQRRALQLVRAGHNVFVSGAAGTGKTEWLQYALDHVLHARPAMDGGVEVSASQRGRVAVTAATGIAARLIGGQTVHAFSGIGRGEGDADAVLQRVQSRHDVVRAWQLCEVLVIDEVSMLSAHVFALLDRIARVLRAPLPPSPAPSLAGERPRNNAARPFGGLQLLVVGDFLQLPPVVSRGAGEEARLAFTSPAWASCNFRPVLFSTNHRHSDDDAFAKCCAEVRRGICSPHVRAVLESCLHRELDERFGVTATTLMARRRDVEAYNARQLQELDSMTFHRYASEDYAAVPGADIDSEVSLPALLTLKVGAQVVLLASLPETPALANGDLGVVVGFVAQAHGPAALPRVRFTNGVEAVVPAITMEVYGRDGRLSLSRQQVPLQLAWALTVHRVQGMTLPMARLALDGAFFESGQAYVALSRVRRAADLSLTAFEPSVIERVSHEAKAFYEKIEPTASPHQTAGVGDGRRTEAPIATRLSASPAADVQDRRRPRSESPEESGRQGSEDDETALKKKNSVWDSAVERAASTA